MRACLYSRHTVVLTEDGIILATKPRGGSSGDDSGTNDGKFIRVPISEPIRDIATNCSNDDIIGLTCNPATCFCARLYADASVWSDMI